MARQEIPQSGLWGPISDLINANTIELYDLASKVGSAIIINSEADFAVQSPSTITFEDEKTYIFGSGFSTSKSFIVGRDVSLLSFNPSGQSNTIEYTGTGVMFQGTDVGSFFIKGLPYRAPNGSVFSITDTTPNSIINIDSMAGTPANNSSLVAQSLGTFTNVFAFIIDNSSAFSGLGINQGLTFSGSCGLLSIGRLGMNSTSPSFVGVNLGSAVFSSAFEIRDLLTVGVSGAIGISGLPSSGNIGAGITGVIRDSEFIGDITPLSGISASDIRYSIKNCPPIPDSTKNADAYLTSQQTVVVSGSLYSPIAGVNWQNDILERFTGGTNGELIYIGQSPAKFQVMATATVSKVGGGADTVGLAIQVNGSTSLKTVATTQNSNPTSLTSVGLFTLNPGDSIRSSVANLSTNSSIVVDRAVLNIIDGF